MRTIDLRAPTCWEELSPEQVLFVAALYDKGIERADFLSRAFIKFTNIKALQGLTYGGRFRFCRGKEFFSLDPADFHAFAEKLSWLVESPGLMQPPGIKGYASPDRMMYDSTLDEYLTADFLYIGAARCDGEERREMLCRFIAALWRCQGEAFADELPELRYRKFQRKKSVHTAAFLWWTGLKNKLREQYPSVFAGGEGSEISPRETALCLLSIFNEGKPQDNERILRTKAHEVFWELELKINTNRERKNRK